MVQLVERVVMVRPGALEVMRHRAAWVAMVDRPEWVKVANPKRVVLLGVVVVRHWISMTKADAVAVSKMHPSEDLRGQHWV